MDTRTPGSNQAVNVDDKIAMIKDRMPETYKSIQAKAQAIGREAYALVRRGLRGEPNCFYAFERAIVVGTPFKDCEIERDIAQLMVQFGSTFVCIWGETAAVPVGAGQEVSHGTH